MSGGKEIRTKIGSIKNTQKITRAMEMVAASKMRKAQDRMFRSRPYAQKIRTVIHHLARSHSEYHHNYMVEREVKRVGMIIVSTDRGLCGGLNANQFRSTLEFMTECRNKDVGIDLATIGVKGEQFFNRFSANILGSVNHLGDKPGINDLIGIVKIMLTAFDEGKVDEVYVTFNEFVNTMSQKPHRIKLLPIEPSKEEALSHYWDYIYEPDSKELLDGLLVRFIESQVYQAVVENIACEQASRMVAMKSASDNAGDIIQELQLAYNKARQASITKELSEIVGGAAAV